MREVARLIRVRSQMGPGRQVFFCSIGGFDTHSAQMGTHANLLRDLSQSLSAFAYATLDLGLAGNVTTFTQSEFNRTTQTNGTGTDHAWGSHQIVLGGAVQGGHLRRDAGLRARRRPRMPATAASGFRPSGRCSSAPRSAAGSARRPGELAWAFPNLTNFATPGRRLHAVVAIDG